MPHPEGFVEVTKHNLAQLPKMLEVKGSGVFIADPRSFPSHFLTIDLFFNAKVDIEKREIWPPARRIDLVDRHYRIASKNYRSNPLSHMFESLKLGDQKSPTLVMIGYQGSIMHGFLEDTPLYYFASKAAAPKAIVSFLSTLDCLRKEGLREEEYKRIEQYIDEDLRTKSALKKNIDAGQAADALLFDA
jgi:hypothetical protein